jgi:hypothetical protein
MRNLNNKDYSQGEPVNVLIGQSTVKCEFMEPISGGYTKALVKDIDPDVTTISTINRCWSKQLKRNHARGAEYIVHVKDITKIVSNHE